MKTYLPRWLSPPLFPDERQMRRPDLLHWLLIAIILLISLDAVVLFFLAPETIPTFWLNGVSVLCCAVLLWIVRRGHVRLAGRTLCFVLWVLAAYYITVSGGLRSPAL